MRYYHVDDILLDVCSKSLGHILQTLAESPEILASPGLSSKVSNALGFYNEMRLHYENVLADLEELKAAHRLTDEDPVEQMERQLPEKIVAYQEMREKGSDRNEIYGLMQRDGLSYLHALKALRSVFAISLEEAKQVVDRPEIGRPDSSRE